MGVKIIEILPFVQVLLYWEHVLLLLIYSLSHVIIDSTRYFRGVWYNWETQLNLQHRWDRYVFPHLETKVKCLWLSTFYMPPMVILDWKTLAPYLTIGEYARTIYGLSSLGLRIKNFSTFGLRTIIWNIFLHVDQSFYWWMVTNPIIIQRQFA